MPRYRILRAIVLAGLAALTLSTHVFVDVDRVRVKIVQVQTSPTAGSVRATTSGFRQVQRLRTPFALIAQIDNRAAETRRFSITVDGAPVCERDVAGGSRRVDCAVTTGWTSTSGHDVAIQGPPAAWTLEYLELATQHGGTDGAHSLLILPASSGNYVRPAPGWVIAVWLALTLAFVFLPASSRLPRWLLLLYRVAASLVVLEWALCQCSQWISDYRLVLSAGTFAGGLVLLLAPRLWVAGRLTARSGVTYVRPRPMAKVALAAGLIVCVSLAIAWPRGLKGRWEEFQARRHAQQARSRLFAELQPVKLTNCEFERFGEPHDGGYILCANLLTAVRAGYSYGISGYDQWGCDVSRRLGVPVHQYDCFNLKQPICAGGRTVFHGECVAGEPATIDGRAFDTPEGQFEKNGDGRKRVVVKMDVEGAEWDTLLRTPAPVLRRIDQLTIEMHGVREEDRVLETVMKLKEFFYVANLHFNNFSCQADIPPFPAAAYEVLFVSKRIAVRGGSGPAGAPQALMTANNPGWKDCQTLSR